jgi:hypothetical protein
MGGLFNSTILDVMVGLIFIYILLAIMCSSINEWIAGLFRLRSATLAQGIEELLDCQKGSNSAGAVQKGADANASNTGGASGANVIDPKAEQDWLLNEFKQHPLITAMRKDAGRLPTYIPSRTFATALMDIVTPNNQGPITFNDLETGVKGLPDGDVKKSLLALIQNAQDDLEKAQKNIEAWYDDTMDQVSGWYKRKAAWVTIGVAIFLTLGTNADTIQITRNLWTNPTVREQIVEQSKKSGSTLPTDPSKQVLDSLGGVLPSWSQLPYDTLGWLERVLGWLLTVAAVSLGAPFWFDLLNKLANIRNAGQKPDKATGAST